MPRYILAGTDSDGRHQTELVSAPSADEAARQFTARGFTGVTLHSDEGAGQYFESEVSDEFFKYMTPKEYVAVNRMSRGRLLLNLLVRVYRLLWWLLVPLLALVVSCRLFDVHWYVIAIAAVGLLLVPPGIVLYAVFFSPCARAARVMSLFYWGRWGEVLAALRETGPRSVRPALERSDSAPIVAFYAATALAGLGRLDEALEAVQPYVDAPELPAWKYWLYLADVFDTARVGDRVLECAEKAVEIAPDNQNALLDLALHSLSYRRDVARARAMLDELRRHVISETTRPFLVMTEGLLALEEGRPERARELLREAVRLAQPFRYSSAMTGALINRMHTYLTLACAAAGDHAAAEAHFNLAEPWLRAVKLTDLIERCEAALGRRA